AHDVDRVAGRQLELLDRLGHGVDDRDGVRARLLAHRQGDRRDAVAHGAGFPILLGVFEVGDVAHADAVVALLAHDDVTDLLGLGGAALEAQRHVLRPGLDRAARYVDVTIRDRALHFERRHASGCKPDRIEVDVDLTLAPAEQHDLTDALQALDALLDLFLG